MKLPRTVAYAIHAISLLAAAKSGVPVPCSQLARQGNMPERFLLQILRKLVKQGVLESTCGVAGGYFLSRPPERIALSDVMEAIDNTLEFSMPVLHCMSPVVRAHFDDAMRSASSAAITSFRSMSVAELVHGDAAEQRLGQPNLNGKRGDASIVAIGIAMNESLAPADYSLSDSLPCRDAPIGIPLGNGRTAI